MPLVLSVLGLVMTMLAGSSGCGSADDPGGATPTTATTIAPTSETTSQNTRDSTSDGDDGTSDGDDSTSGTNGDDSSSGSGTTAPPKKRNVIEWILGLGVDAPSGPTGRKDDMFRALSQRRCDVVDDEFPVLGATAAACLAASGTGDTELLWDRATQVRDATDHRALDCLDAAAYQLLDALVDAHQDHPELPFRFTTGDGETTSTCLVATAVSPSQGTSGDLVTIRGRNLHRATAVQLGDPTSAADVTGTIVQQTRSRLQVKLPADIQGSGQNLRILWQEPTGQSTAWVPFSYGPGSDGDSAGSSEDEGATTDEGSTTDEDGADEGGSDQDQAEPGESPDPETAAPETPSESPAE